MAGNRLRELYIEELRDLYDAENQLIKALPKMTQAAKSEDLRSGIEHHLEQTKEHARRMEQNFDALGERAEAKKCKGMQGIISEGIAVLKEDWEGAVAELRHHFGCAACGALRDRCIHDRARVGQYPWRE